MNITSYIKGCIKNENLRTAKILDYPSKGIIYFIILFIGLSSGATFFVTSMLYSHFSPSILPTILIVIMIVFVYIVYIKLFYDFSLKSIKFYEKKYGATGLGHEYLKKGET